MPIILISHAKLIVVLKLFKNGWNKCDPRGFNFAFFNLHFIEIINTKYHCIWSTCTHENKTF